MHKNVIVTDTGLQVIVLYILRCIAIYKENNNDLFILECQHF